MKASPDKYQTLAIGNKTHAKKHYFYLKQNLIECEFEDEAKLLVVTIGYQLKFNTHIYNICNKASRQLNVVKRVGRYLNKFNRLDIHPSFFLSN